MGFGSLGISLTSGDNITGLNGKGEYMHAIPFYIGGVTIISQKTENIFDQVSGIDTSVGFGANAGWYHTGVLPIGNLPDQLNSVGNFISNTYNKAKDFVVNSINYCNNAVVAPLDNAICGFDHPYYDLDYNSTNGEF